MTWKALVPGLYVHDVSMKCARLTESLKVMQFDIPKVPQSAFCAATRPAPASSAS
jgi:hypothetical protein